MKALIRAMKEHPGASTGLILVGFLRGVLPDTVSEKPKKGFIAAQLLRSVGALFSLLRSCEPKRGAHQGRRGLAVRFVKCVKTNHQKQPMVIDEELVKSQLHTLSIIEPLS